MPIVTMNLKFSPMVAIAKKERKESVWSRTVPGLSLSLFSSDGVVFSKGFCAILIKSVSFCDITVAQYYREYGNCTLFFPDLFVDLD